MKFPHHFSQNTEIQYFCTFNSLKIYYGDKRGENTADLEKEIVNDQKYKFYRN